MQLLLGRQDRQDQDLMDTLGTICSGRGGAILDAHEGEIETKLLALSFEDLRKSHPEVFVSCFDLNDGARKAFLELLQDKSATPALFSSFFEAHLGMLEREKSAIEGLRRINRLAAFLALLDPEKRALLEYKLLPEGLRERISADSFLLMRRLWPSGMDADFKQNGFGDCYFLAVLYGLLQTGWGRKRILNLFPFDDENRDGKAQDGLAPWLVRFDGEVKPEKQLEVASLKAEGYAKRAVKGARGVQILERLFARLVHRQNGDAREETTPVGRESDFEGGWPRVAMNLLCGERVRVQDIDLTACKRDEADWQYVKEALFARVSGEEVKIATLCTLSFRDVLDRRSSIDFQIGSGMSIESAVGLEREHSVWYVNGKHGAEPPKPPSLMYNVPLALSGKMLVHGVHAYAVTDIDPAKRTFTLVNPHDTSIKTCGMDARALDFFGRMTIGRFVPSGLRRFGA
jgi:hypothetical protein